MVFALYFLILVLNFVFFVFKKRSKLVALVSIAAIFFILAGNNYNVDYKAYSSTYQNNNLNYYEIGFRFLANFFFHLGLSYQQFLFIIFGIWTICFIFLLFFSKANAHVFIPLYMLTMLFYDAIQIRQSVSLVLITIAIIFVSKNKSIIALLLILLSALFHQTSLLFIPVLFFSKRNKILKICTTSFFVLAILACFFIFANGNSISFIGDFISKFIGTNKSYYFETTTRFGFLEYFAFYFITLTISYLFYVFFQNNGTRNMRSLSTIIFNLNLYLVFILPLLMGNTNFIRLLKYILLGQIILFAYLFELMRSNDSLKYPCLPLFKKKITKNILFSAFVVFLVSYCFIIQVFSFVIDVFSNNVFLGSHDTKLGQYFWIPILFFTSLVYWFSIKKNSYY